MLEIVLTVSGNNSTTRWTEGLGIPQEMHRVYLTPAAPKYRDRASLVAPLGSEAKSAPAIIASRPPLESRAEVEKALTTCRARKPLIALASAKAAQDVLPKGWQPEVVPAWVRLLAHFPKAGGSRVTGLYLAETKGNIDALTRARIDWICARHDRAWYAIGHAYRRLRTLGESPDAIFALDGSWEKFSPKERATFHFVRKLTVAPAHIVDEDVAGLRKLYTDAQVAELVYRVCNAAFFDRLTETFGLPLES